MDLFVGSSNLDHAVRRNKKVQVFWYVIDFAECFKITKRQL